MTVKECAVSADKSQGTIRNWLDKRGLKSKKIGFKGEIFIDPEDWKHFCHEHGIPMEGEG